MRGLLVCTLMLLAAQPLLAQGPSVEDPRRDSHLTRLERLMAQPHRVVVRRQKTVGVWEVPASLAPDGSGKFEVDFAAVAVSSPGPSGDERAFGLRVDVYTSVPTRRPVFQPKWTRFVDEAEFSRLSPALLDLQKVAKGLGEGKAPNAEAYVITATGLTLGFNHMNFGEKVSQEAYLAAGDPSRPAAYENYQAELQGLRPPGSGKEALLLPMGRISELSAVLEKANAFFRENGAK